MSQMDLYQQYILMSRYSRFDDELGRRETLAEVVARWRTFFDKHTGGKHTETVAQLAKAIENLEVMPSMRSLMTAGPALEREHLAGYNCAYLAVDSKRALAETLYVLMCGTGVGFSCEAAAVAKLPPAPEELHDTDNVISVADSREGWAKAFDALLRHLWNGDVPTVDYSKLRPKGARLKTFGGRSSGSEPLRRLFEFTVALFRRAGGRRLAPLEVHDLMCIIGEVVVVGGVRRSALISLSSLDDPMLARCKSVFDVDQYALVNETETEWRYTITMKRGQPCRPTYNLVLSKEKHARDRDTLELKKKVGWWLVEPQRSMANNSVAYDKRPNAAVFLREWHELVRSTSGERGLFNREAARKQAAKGGRRAPDAEYGCNPCSEIILLNKQLCNLTEVVARADDTLDTLLAKVRTATIMGTMQASLTKFGFVSEAWVRNTKLEALLGVSITGIMDCPLLNGSEGLEELASVLRLLRNEARETNEEWAPKLGVNVATAITCVKPSGTVSQLCNTSSGIHPRHNRNYIRTVRVDKKDPLYQFMKDKGFPTEDDVLRPDATAVVSFAMTAPAGAKVREDFTAMEMLEIWACYQEHWCEHKPSATISVRDDEWLEVGAWVWHHFDSVSGVSFLPYEEHSYQQAPYQDMTPEALAAWQQANPVQEFDWAELGAYEDTDNTAGVQTLACSAGYCELPGT